MHKSDYKLFQQTLAKYLEKVKTKPKNIPQDFWSLTDAICERYKYPKPYGIDSARNILFEFLVEGSLKHFTGVGYQRQSAVTAFYQSDNWKKLRYLALKYAGGRCALCGRSAKDGVTLHVDHIIPLSKDWSQRNNPDNLQVLCEDCNKGKSNDDCIRWK